MTELTYKVRGLQRPIHYLNPGSDVSEFWAFLARSDGMVALDIETTSLDVFSRDWRIRLVQFGTAEEAWVLPADSHRELIKKTLSVARLLVIHTTDYFDLLGVDRAGLASLDITLPKTVNTYILAHLLDPRAKGEGNGAIGHGLKALAAKYVDPDASDGRKELTTLFRTEYKSTIAKGWAAVDIDHPTFVTYAGLDAIYTFALYEALSNQIRELQLTYLSQYEHAVARVTTRLVRQGMLLDVDYTTDLVRRFTIETESCRAQAAELGCENVNAPAQVAAALMATGWKPTALTPSGAPQVDKAVLGQLEASGSELAEVIVQAKRASKWRDSYAQAMLDVRDSADRVHPKIASLKARTARMSISAPPLQQLPSRDSGGSSAWLIRRCLVADPGNVVVSVDYEALEMRMLAALADVKIMKASMLAGEDLHEMTAALLYGPDFTPTHRKIAKNVGYGKIYGGGAKGVARLTGAPVSAVSGAIKRYDEAFPEMRLYSDKLRSEALNNDLVITTAKGRRLPVDSERLYAAVNYKIQSMARDLLADALLEADKAGLTPYMLLPIHDEILAQASPSESSEVAATLAGIMYVDDFHGVSLPTGSQIGGRSWGSLYGSDDEIEELAA